LFKGCELKVDSSFGNTGLSRGDHALGGK
jgi:hypothetical protein